MAKKEDDGEQLPLNLQGGANLTKVKREIAEADKQITKIEGEMEALQAQRQAIRDNVKALGVGKRQFDQARRDKKTDAEVRTENDLSYQIAREALGIQIEPFYRRDEEAEANPRNKPREQSAVKQPVKKAAAKAQKAPAKKAKVEHPPTDLGGNIVNLSEAKKA
jgi:hypothetical protein